MNKKQFSLDFMDTKISKVKVLEILRKNKTSHLCSEEWDYVTAEKGFDCINIKVIEEIEKL